MIIPKLFLLILLLKTTNALLDLNVSSDGLVVDLEQRHKNWVKIMGSLNHSLFSIEENLFDPCLTINVDKEGKYGGFTTVQEAINSVPDSNQCRVVILVHAGIYREKVLVPVTKKYITLEGESAHNTIIVWNDTAEQMGKNGQPMSTYWSATASIEAPFFIAKHISFKNRAPPPQSNELGKQAVALRIRADAAAFINCKFVGSHDTLYDHQGRHYFRNCYIRGSVDIIFGDGLSLYENYHLHAQNNNSYGALTAQRRENYLEETGFSFVNCRVTGLGALYLGRAWGSFSRVVFAYSYLDNVRDAGWDNWGDKNREMTVFYGQYKCWGPGADYEGRVRWSRELTDQEAEPFVSLNFIGGNDWLPRFS